MRGKKFLLLPIISAILAGCGGSPDPEIPAPTETIRGVNLFYLGDPYQDIPYILRTIDEPQTLADLDRILTALQAANVNAIRLLVAADHFPLNKLPNAWPIPDPWQTEGLRKLVDIVSAKGMKSYLVFVGKTIEEKNTQFISAEKDLIWFNSFLSAVDRSAIIRVDLSGDVFMCDDLGCERNDYQREQADYIRQIWAGRPQDWPVGYEAGGPTPYIGPEGVKNTIRWTQTNTPGASVSMGFYSRSTDVAAVVAAIDSMEVPVWISEYGGDPEFYQEFLTAACKRKWPMFAWTAGVGWSGYGLWHPTLNDPTPQLKILSEKYQTCN